MNIESIRERNRKKARENDKKMGATSLGTSALNYSTSQSRAAAQREKDSAATALAQASKMTAPKIGDTRARVTSVFQTPALKETSADRRKSAERESGVRSGYTTRQNEEQLAALKVEKSNLEARLDLEGAAKVQTEIDKLEKLTRYADKSYEDKFTGQFAASNAQGRLAQDEAMAWDAYLANPSAENKRYAQQMSAVLKQFQERNAATLDADATLPWLSQSLAGYLPQFGDQLKAQVGGGLAGAALGSLIAPGVGTAKGAKAGAVAATGAQSYSIMRGAAFKELLDLGVDEEIARKAAKDEAFISALIEMGDTMFDLANFGIGKLIDAAAKGTIKALAKKGAEEAAESAGKKLLKALGKYGLNVAQEMAEEGTQQAVSIANRERAQAGIGAGKLDLVGKSVQTARDAFFGGNTEARDEIVGAAKEGGKIAAMMGGATMAGTNLVNRVVTSDGREVSPEEFRKAVRATVPSAARATDEQIDELYGVLADNLAQERAQEQAEVSGDGDIRGRAEAAFAETGMKNAAKIRRKADTVARLIAGERVEDGDIDNLALNTAENREIFSQLTGVDFEGMKLTPEALRNAARSAAEVKKGQEVKTEVDFNHKITDEVGAEVNEAEEVTQTAEQMLPRVENPQLVRDKNWRKAHLSSKDTRRLDAAAKVLGVEIRFAETVDEGESNAKYENGVITLALDAKDPVMTSVIHESIHRIRELDADSYDTLSRFVQDTMSDIAVDSALYSRSKAYGTDNVDTLTEEMVADAFGRMLGDTQLLDRFVQDNRSAAEKILDVVRDVLNAIKRVLTDQNRQLESWQKEAFRDLRGDLQNMERLFTEAMNRADSMSQTEKNTATKGGEGKKSFKGYDPETGRGIYEGNFPKNTPKTQKAARILGFIQNVWSKKPIDLIVRNTDGTTRTIKAQFDPTYDENPSVKTDASKLMGGNRHGTASERRVTLDLADDYYQIASEASFNYSKPETGKESETHKNVNEWHYFINDILYREHGEKETAPYRVTVNVKERSDGSFVYSFNAERQDERSSTRQTLHADVTPENSGGNAQPSDIRLPHDSDAVKQNNGHSSKNVRDDLDAYIAKYGALPKGERPVRDTQIPKQTSDSKKVSQTVRTILEAGATPDAAVPTIEEMVAKGEFSYEVHTDKQAMADADTKIRSKGYASALADWTADVRAGKVSKANTAMGWALYNNAANAGDIKTAIDILDNMVQHQRNAAQAVQATRILKQLSPEAQLYGVQRSVDNLQKELDERNRETEKRQEQRRQAGKAVRDARQEAAKDIRDGLSGAKVTRRGNRVEVEGNQAGEPFVFEYAQKVGEALAKGLSKKTPPKHKTYLQQITAQLKRFANEKMEKTAGRKALTATELLRDYVQNQEFYAQAWEAAQLELRQTHGNDPALEEFINSGIGVDSSMNPRNAIFMRALVKAAAESQENRGMLAKQSALGFTGMAETIADKLIRDVGAEGSVADTIRDAAAAYVNDVLRESDADQSKLIESAIRSAMKDIGTSFHDIVSAGATAKATAREAVIGKLIGKYGFGKADATYVADIVGEAFDKMSRERAEKTLESRFKDRPDRKRKSMADLLQEYGNLGAFDAGSRFNEAAAVRIFKSDVALRVNEDLARAFLEAKTEGDRANILKDIYRDIGRQLPSRFIDKWNAWRYLAMLGNLRTHVRNVGGNAGFAPVVVAKNLTATAIEEAVFRVSGGKLQRSKAFVGFGKSDRALLKAAWDDYDKVEEAALSGGKYSDFANANKYIEEGRVIFKNKALEAARRGNSKALDREDVWFSRPHYAAAMAGYCKRHGLSPEQIMRGKETANARAYAIKEAQKATYRDTNALSQTISGLGRVQGDNPVRKGLGTVVEGILPFRKTPANILARGIEYSPLGLMNGIKQAVWDVKRGTKTGAEAIDSISAGLTGTGLLALGVYMAAQGLVRGHGSDDDDENEFMELMGHQGYALELPGGSSVTLDWLAPEALPYFIGVNLWEQTKGSDEALTLSAMLNAVKTVTEPLLEMSCLQSLNDVFDAVGYAASDGLDGLPAALASAATSYLTQGLPTILGQAERAGEGVRMTTYTERNAFLTSDMQYTLGRASARIPGWDYQQIPYIDAWGRMESSGGTAARVGNNFLNPAYTSTVESSPMEDELLRLYEQTGERKVLPSRAAKYFNVDGERKDLTGEEYVKYATAKGQTAYDILSGLTANAAYQSMDDASKAEAVGKVYEYANAVAKTAVSDYKPEGWVAKAIEAQKRTKISPEQYVTAYLAQSGVGSLTDTSGKTIENSHSLLVMEAVYDIKGLTEQQRKQLFDDFGVGKSVKGYAKLRVKKELDEMRKLAS